MSKNDVIKVKDMTIDTKTKSVFVSSRVLQDILSVYKDIQEFLCDREGIAYPTILDNISTYEDLDKGIHVFEVVNGWDFIIGDKTYYTGEKIVHKKPPEKMKI